ncbi:MAG TPA: type II toxin-antitoxin system VapC family toxin [Longimicrobium sp.]|nr:type II toxin-antitoxin system VapC family toxin [Longimicrobium sp.]
MDKPTVYIETSIVSYLAASPSRHPVTARNQRLTHEWWNTHRHRYALYTSTLVADEARSGDPVLARHRLALLQPIPRLEPEREEVRDLARELRAYVPLPANAHADALHIALAAVEKRAYLLTWDSRHIANPRLHTRIEKVCEARGFTMPVLCTPREMKGG